MSESEISHPESSKTQELKSQKRKTVTFMTSDGEEFSLPVRIAEESRMVKSVLSEGLSENIPLPDISGPVISKLIEYWQKVSKTEQWKEEFFKEMKEDMLCEFLIAANYLDSKDAYESVCQFLVDTVKDFSVEKSRDYFGVTNDYTPEEEAKLRQECPWVFEQES
ncbi:hypothetical protein LUZ60_014204 [Juncus effusus]|nr:hypothetical protein LUZ60_014204 [Juncus effusus]